MTSDRPASTRSTSKLPFSKKLVYAGAGFALTIVALPIHVYMPKFYSDVVGVSVGTIGVILAVGRIFDAFTDPALGILSDRLRTRWGRRRPFVLLASFPLAVAVFMLLVPPASLGESAAILWLAAALFLVYLFWTAVVIPYEALGVEISVTYDERSSVMGVRDGGALIAVLVAVVTPPILGELLSLDERAKFFTFAAMYAPLVVVMCAVAAARLHERPVAAEPVARPQTRWRELLANRPFVILVSAYTLIGVSTALPATLLLYYVPYVLGSDKGEIFMVMYVGSGILCAPLWIWLAQRFEKKTTFLAALGINGLAHLAVFFLRPGDETLYMVLVLIAGIPVAALIALPAAMYADAIDHGEQLSGERQEGLYIGVLAVVRKITAAVALGTALLVLDRIGYVANAEQTPGVQLTLRILYAVVPAAFQAAAFAIMLRYPIDRARHDEIRAATTSP